MQYAHSVVSAHSTALSKAVQKDTATAAQTAHVNSRAVLKALLHTAASSLHSTGSFELCAYVCLQGNRHWNVLTDCTYARRHTRATAASAFHSSTDHSSQLMLSPYRLYTETSTALVTSTIRTLN
eukprot:7785-Heterococcus_DN1.PRE.4